jgi:hypothetical protein
MNVVDEHHAVLDLDVMKTTLGGTLVNFDSHPDLGLPAESTDIDIATWIVPKLVDGTFSRVVYVTLFGHAPCGTFRVRLWKDEDDGYHIAETDSRLPAWWRAYWDIDSDTPVPAANCTSISITVVNLKDALPVLRGIEGKVVVSVDLDFFDVRNPLFDEVTKLPSVDQLVFQFLTCLRPGAAYDSLDVDVNACRSCEFVSAPVGKPLRQLAPNHLQTCFERARKRLAKMPTDLVNILVQGAGQPHHPTNARWRRAHMYPAFFDCLTALPPQSPVVIAESRAYRSTPGDGLLKDIQSMVQLRDQLS